MTPYFVDETVTLHLGDCLEVLRALPDASVDAVVCDPPYGLAELSTGMVVQAIAAWMAGDRDHVPDGPGGFMGRRWDRFVPPPGAWDECLRVLKPGGHLVAFASPRTVDLMGLSIRIAGFDIRDSLHWIFGSGFSKGINVSKAIDKVAGVERQVIGASPFVSREPRGTWTGEIYGDEPACGDGPSITAPATEDAARWEGWNTTLKPAHEPIVLARKPLAGTVAATVLAHGTGALNINACRVEGIADNARANKGGYLGYNGGDRPDKPYTGESGRWPTNVVYSHPPLLDADDQVVGDACADGCVPGCPVAELDRQSGHLKSGANPDRRRSDKFRDAYGEFSGQESCTPARSANEGGASRFFPVFRYEAKAPASERPRLADGTAWPTVKPLALMRWLVRLVTPRGGLILDPFCGSGTTSEAAAIEGFRAVLIDQDPVAAELTRARLSKPIAPVLDFFEGEIA